MRDFIFIELLQNALGVLDKQNVVLIINLIV